MVTSVIPSVLDGLVALFNTTLTGFIVIDGQPAQTPDQNFACVGWTPDGGRVSFDEEPLTAGWEQRIERATIPCYLDVASGDEEPSSHRAAGFTALGLLKTALHTSPTLGGVLPAQGFPAGGIRFEGGDVLPEKTGSGDSIGITFRLVYFAALND